MPKTFLGKRIFILTAHPDDEAYTSSGTIYKSNKAGGETFLVCATRGERGMSHLKKAMSLRQLGAVRKKELYAAARFLGIKKLFLFNFPDGKVRDHKKALLAKSLRIARSVKPDYVMSFGPSGSSGHLDHIAAAETARRIAHTLKVPLVSFALSPKLMANASKWLRSRRKSGRYIKRTVFIKPNLRVKIDGAIKKKTIGFHKSQMDGRNAYTGFPKYAVKELLRAEYFTVSK